MSSALNKLQENWEGFAQADPLWAICVDSFKRDRKWEKEEFFATGRTEVGRVMEYLRSLGVSPDRSSAALDFGCGVGRLTRALAGYFPECWGVDISPTMIRLAREFNQGLACHFCLNETNDLKVFPDERFGFVYSSIVLQHIPRKHVERYVAELIRVLKTDGIFVFQAPDREKAPLLTRLRHKAGLRQKIARLQGRKTVAAFRMEMHCVPEDDVRALLHGMPVRVLDVQLTNSSTGGFNGNLQFLEREPESGFVSKQYCLIKTARRGLTLEAAAQRANLETRS
jgi:SAM-dependent methyltransferase